MKALVLILAALAALTLVSCASTGSGAASAPAKKAKNLAVGAEIDSNNHIMDFIAANAVDGDTPSYWEGAANQYPNTLTVNLGKSVTTKNFTIKLNPKRIWASRTQNIEVQASADGSTFKTVVPATDYLFDPNDNGNLVNIPVATSAQWFRLVFTSNTEATGGQVAEWEIYGAE